MADRREVGVDLVTRLKDKGFKDLQKQTSRTEKQLQKFGRRLTAVFSTVAIVNFVKKSVAAFGENEKALRRLNLELNNLGLGFAQGFANEFVKTLSLATGIADDELNPALQKLLRTTYTLTDSQKLLSLAVDITKQTGADLNTVVNALTRAYLGDTKALARLNIGYTSAGLKGKEFADILAELQKKFGGAALATQDTYATSIDRLKVAFDEAREAIGEGFIKGLEESGLSVDEFIPKIIELGDKIGRALGKAAGFIENIDDKLEELAKNPIIKTLIRLYELLDTKSESERLQAATKQEAALNKAAADRYAASLESQGRLVKLAEEETRLAKLRAAELARLRAEEKRRAAEKKRTAELDRLRNSIQFKFDIDAINQQAALRRNISKEDRDRVLQLAALKISDYQTDEEALVTLKAATTGFYDDRMNLEMVYQLLKTAGFAADKNSIEALAALKPSIDFKDNLDAIIAKLKALIEGKYTISIGATITIPPIPAFGSSSSSGIGAGSKFDPGSFRKKDEDTSKDLPSVVIPPVIKPPFIDLPGEAGGEPAFAAKPLFPDIGSFRFFEENESSRLRNLYGPGAVPSNFDPSAFRFYEETGFTSRGMETPDFFDPARFRMKDEGVVVNVNVSGSLISQNDLVAAVTDAVYQTQRSGNALLIAE